MSFKIAAYRKAELALAKQVAEFEALKADPELRKELEFSGHLDEFLKQHGMSRSRLQEFLSMQGVTASAGATGAAKTTKTYNKHPGRVYTNPHTKQTITVKRIDNKVLQGWVEQYGQDEVNSWLHSA